MCVVSDATFSDRGIYGYFGSVSIRDMSLGQNCSAAVSPNLSCSSDPRRQGKTGRIFLPCDFRSMQLVLPLPVPSKRLMQHEWQEIR